ncbi:MAG TPA: response regulator [Marinagarivorans sp.]
MSKQLFYLEDDEVLAHLTSRAFERLGFSVAHFSTLADAEQAINAVGYSHALLDMKLNDGNSLSLIKQLAHQHPSIKILLLTGYASIATAVQAVKLGAYNYLPKPASINEILAAFGEQAPSSPDVDTHSTMSLKRLEWEKIQQALADNDGNITLTAKQLNMHRRTLQRKLGKKPVAT